MNKAASIGIIGGADGPTAIFVTTSPGDWTNWILPVLAVVGVAAWFIWRKRKK